MTDTLTGFLYCVFDSLDAEGEDRSGGHVYLRNRAEARYIEELLAPLYYTHRVGISTSDDSVIAGSALVALGVAVHRAIESVEAQPESWPVVIGHRFEPYQTDLGPAIVQYAYRSALLEFLREVSIRIERASQAHGFLHWAGGE